MVKNRHFLWYLLSFVLLITLVAVPHLVRAAGSEIADLQAVWELVKQSGAYSFTADLTQTTTRDTGVIAYGSSTQKARLHLEGQTDLETNSLEFTLWNGGGSVALPESGTQFRITDGQAQARQGGGPWQTVEDFSGMVAPGGDFLAFLTAAKNVVRHEPEQINTELGQITITRFTFDIDGPQYAAYMRDLMADQMWATGELPPGVNIDLPEAYSAMIGQGELWVGEDGLPVSENFDLAFPAGSFGTDEGPATVHIAATFSQFAQSPNITFIQSNGPAAAKLNQILGQGRDILVGISSFRTLFAILTLVVVMGVMLVIMRRSGSRPVYAVVAVTVIFTMLVSPLLNSMHVAAYSDNIAARQAAQEEQQAETEAANDWQEALTNPNFDPHTSPLAQAKNSQGLLAKGQSAGNGITGGGIISATTNNSKYFDSACETDPNNDNDGDNLTNLEECLIGTLPGSVDTDQDGVDDDLEVKGFSYEGSTTIWYTNPLYPDTNRDGLGDGNEWHLDNDGDGLPDDTDGNGIPDIWDDDNDGDGVPDNLDLSPYSTTKDTNTFDEDNPLLLIVDDLGEGLITKVEFQLSPTDPDHLWYTNNVLDWADNDRQGQMQDADGLTFYDVQNTADNPIDPFPNDLGDVRLVPMLEIEITGTPNNLPDGQMLDKFGISIHENDNNSTTAYVPVNLVTDTTGDKNVAFHGAMYYQANSAWGNAHTVRLVWLVQALVDVCKTYKNNICDTYEKYNDMQVIHSYDEEWYLTGMEVSEEHRTNIAVIYPDPAEAEDAPLYLDTLYPMAYGLDRTFVAGADCEVVDQNDQCVSGNDKFDLTVTGIYTRFNHTTNGGVADEQRWYLDNVFNVYTDTYSAVELAMMDITVTQTKKILTETYTSQWSPSNPITPTMMYAWEHNYRVVSLSNDHLSWTDNTLVVDVANSGSDPVPIEQVNGMKWAPFGYNENDGWFSADMSSYWTTLDTQLPDYFSAEDDIPANVATSKYLYMGMYSGETHVVSKGDKLIPAHYEISDLPLGLKIISYVGSGINKALSAYYGKSSGIKAVFKIIDKRFDAPLTRLERAAQSIDDYIQTYTSLLQKSIGIFGIGLLLLTTVAALVVAGIYLFRKYVAHDNIGTGWLVAGAIAMGTLGFALGVIRPVLSMIDTVNELIEVGAVASKADAIASLFAGEGGVSIEFNILGLVISVSITVIFFLVLMGSGQVKSGTIAAQFLAAQTISAILVAFILFVLALNPITGLLVGLAAIIDAILFALGVDFSITGKLTQAIADAFYEFDVSVDTGVNTGAVTTELVNAADGLVAGNKIIFTMPITTVITETQTVKDIADISESEFRNNSFYYEFNAYDAYQTGLGTNHGDRFNDWQISQLPDSRYLGVMYDTASYELSLEAGVNRSFVFFLDSAYELLGESCWWIAGCKNKYVGGNNSSEVGSSFIFDIFPATVEEFADVTSWSTGNVRFADADGDGLLPLSAGGVDPDDTTWDVDGDTLSDQFELSMRALALTEGGEMLDPLLMDTDGDGIPDNEELRVATNPANPDSDGDGLPDIVEAAWSDEALGALTGGWPFAYNINDFTQVWSDPNNADYDGDGMTDLFEMTQDTCPSCTPWANPDNPQLFSPYVYNENPVPIFLDDNSNNGFVTPGSSFVYSTTTENNLSDGILLAGEVSLSLPNIYGGGSLTAEVALNSGYSETLASELQAQVPGSAAGVITSSINLEAYEDVVWAWDPPEQSSMTPMAGVIQQLDAAVSPGFSDLYLSTALELDSSGEQYITAYAYGNSGSPSASNILAALSPAEGSYDVPAVSCNDNGICLVVWAEQSADGTPLVNGVLLNGTVENASFQFWSLDEAVSAVSAVAVSSDGQDFLAGWREKTPGGDNVSVRQVFEDGTTSDIQQVWGFAHTISGLGLTWTGSDYLAVWSNTWDGVLHRAEIDTSLNVGPVTNIVGGASTFYHAGKPTPISLTYDPLSDQALVIYRDLEQDPSSYGDYMSAQRLNSAGSAQEINLDIVYDYTADMNACADPINGGWIVVWSRNYEGSDNTIHYQSIGPDGSLRGSEQTYIVSEENSAVAIACRAPHPLFDLEFEELTTAALYADSSQNNHDFGCNMSTDSCPVGGVEGRFGNGIQFDGINDQIASSFTQPTDAFTIEFWLKTNCQDCGLLSHLGGHASMSLQLGEICASATGSSGKETLCTGNDINFADGIWHHVVHAVDGANHILYVDGQHLNSQTFSSAPTCGLSCGQFQLGVDNNADWFAGTLDEVRFHNRRLSNAEMAEAFDAALMILDLDETAGSNIAYDATHNGYNATCSGSSCPTFGTDGEANTAATFDGVNDYLEIDPQTRTLETYVYDFELGNTDLWSDSTLSTATRDNETTTYLGDHGNYSVNLYLPNLPTHDTVTISFDLYVLGSWAGNRTDIGPDNWQWGYDDTTVLHTNFSNLAGSPNYQTYPAASPASVGGITLYENSNQTGTSETFTADDPDLGNNPIGGNHASAFQIYGDTVAILYSDTNYNGTSWIMDPKRGNNNIPDDDAVSSLRVFSSIHSPRFGATGQVGTLSVPGFSEAAIYHIEYTLDEHTADDLTFFFQGLASNPGSERWGLDNVVVEVQSKDGSIPLTNSDFTISAWVKQDANSWDTIFSQEGNPNENEGVNLYFTPNNLNCSIVDKVLTASIPTFDTDWHHVACVFDTDSQALMLYRDGFPIGSLNTGLDYDGFGDSYIGQLYNGSQEFSGSIDETAVWLDALSDEQISDLYQKVRVEDQSVLHAVVPVQDDASLLTVDLFLRETATGAGNESQVVTKTVTVDGDDPFVTTQAPSPGSYVSGLHELKVSGTASDPTSYVNTVEIQVDGGNWVAATGTEAWSYTIPAGTLNNGLHTFSARTTDVVGHTGSVATVLVVVDDTAPGITLNTPGTLRPIRDEQGRWLVSISGTASDPAAGNEPGSGLAGVEVLLQGGPNVVGNGWQTATVNANIWTVEYILPQVGTGNIDITNPTGVYTVTLRATDAVNNTTPETDYVTGQLTVEIDAPVPTLTTSLPLTRPITTSLTLSGQILDATFISSAEIGFTPGSNIGALDGTVMHLTFDENQALSRYFSDRSGSNNPAVCDLATCPQVGQPGQRDHALQFDGVDDHLTGNGINIANQSFTVAAWAKRDVIDQAHTIAAHGQGNQNHGLILYFAATNEVRCSFWENLLASPQTYTDTDWHHWACTYDKDTGLRTLYRDGKQIAQDSPGTDYLGSGSFAIGKNQGNANHFDGLIDELTVYDRALAGYEITDLYNYGLTTWFPVTFDNNTLNPTWSYTIPEGVDGLEGLYQINLRATDVLSNVTEYAAQRLWRGEIDTRPPQTTYVATIVVSVFPNVTYHTIYTCTATDFNLVADTTCMVVSPDTSPVFYNPGSTAYSSIDLWYADVISDTARQYKYVGNLTLNGVNSISQSMRSCDAYGRCTTVGNSSAAPTESVGATEEILTVRPQLEKQPGLNIDAAVLTPTTGTVLTSAMPVIVSGFVGAESGLQSLSVTVNGVEVYSENWPVTSTITNTVWSFSWSPPAEGVYLFETEVIDWLGNTTAGSYTSTVYVDTAAPVIAINPTVLTTTHQFGNSAVYLTGTASDTVAVHRVQVSVDGGAEQDAGLENTGNWERPWLFNGQPDGELFTVTARATDLAGQTAVAVETVMVDIVPPERVTLTLAYQNSDGQTRPISVGDTLTDAAALEVTWSTSSDGSGIAAYRVGWSQSAAPVPAELTSYPGAGSHMQAVGEAQAWYAHVLVVDNAGNVTAHTQGPVYVDGLLTPDVVNDLSYHGWANETCAIEGVDRRLVHLSPDLNADKEQRFYVTWDQTALRLYWQGANWNHNGDLFVYLDTRPGGSDRLYNPYPGDPNTIYLPGNLPDPAFLESGVGARQSQAAAGLAPEAGKSAVGADYMVWVEDGGQATLYRWEGYDWVVQQALDGEDFQLTPGVAGSDTDLRLPFSEIGIADPSIAALGLLAVATEEESLELWSTMPVRNPVNSSLVVNPLAGLAEEHTFPLVRGYFWDSLDSGLCGNGRLSTNNTGPTGGPFADSDLLLSLTADPVGTTYTFMNDEMAWLWALMFGFEDVPVVPSQLFDHKDNDHPPLGAGQMVTYTLHYQNLGTETAADVLVQLQAWYSLQLTSGSTLNLGDIPPGATGSIQITGLIDPTGVDPAEQEWAALDAFVYDEQYPENPNGGSWSSAPLEWMWSDHKVDVQPPTGVIITSPDFVIPAGMVTVRGQVVDESPVPVITLEVIGTGGSLETIVCPDDTPTDGRWACEWDTIGAADGNTYQVRAQATDGFGQTSQWTEWTTFEVDATPPDFSIDNHEIIYGAGIHHLNGRFTDEREIGYVHICNEFGDCTVKTINPNPDVPPGTLAISGLWASYFSPPPDLAEGQVLTLTLYGQDAAGNRSETVTVTYQIDNTPPELTVNQLVDQIPAIGSSLILSGTVLDGTHTDVKILVDPPFGLRQFLNAAVDGTNWSFTHGWTTPGANTLWVQATDQAGNVTTVGSFTVFVGEVNQTFLPVFFKNSG